MGRRLEVVWRLLHSPKKTHLSTMKPLPKKQYNNSKKAVIDLKKALFY